MFEGRLPRPWFLSLLYYQLCALHVFSFADEMHVPVNDLGCGISYVVGMVFLVDVEQDLVDKGIDVLLAETYVMFSVCAYADIWFGWKELQF